MYCVYVAARVVRITTGSSCIYQLRRLNYRSAIEFQIETEKNGRVVRYLANKLGRTRSPAVQFPWNKRETVYVNVSLVLRIFHRERRALSCVMSARLH